MKCVLASNLVCINKFQSTYQYWNLEIEDQALYIKFKKIYGEVIKTIKEIEKEDDKKIQKKKKKE